MSNARDNIKANIAAEAQYVARIRIDLDAFLALSSDERGARWRQWPVSAKEDAVRQQLMRLNCTTEADDVAYWIAKYDEKYALGPIEQAVEGALERLALENAQHAKTAETASDRAYFRRASTAYTNALIEYRKGVRPDVLSHRAQLLPSRRTGEAPHLVTLDGDWVCSCKAQASMHWPIALVIGLEVAQDAMQTEDDGDLEAEDEVAVAQALLGARLADTAAIVDAMRQAQRCDPPNEPPPLGGDEGDTLPSRAPWYARAAVARRAYLVAA
jgi:hypothetical protein